MCSVLVLRNSRRSAKVRGSGREVCLGAGFDFVVAGAGAAAVLEVAEEFFGSRALQRSDIGSIQPTQPWEVLHHEQTVAFLTRHRIQAQIEL